MNLYFDSPVYLFASGRQALLASLKAMDLQPGDEVIVQAYTCIVVPNAIMAAGGQPVYADILKDTLNLDIEDVKSRITPKTRAIICQHTFGIPADVAALRELCDKHKILLIEDCAHVLPDSDGPAIGKTGDVTISSFGRDKAISGVAGGAAIVRNKNLQSAIAHLESRASSLSWWHIHKLITYPIIYRRALPFYGIGLGKAYLKLKQKLGLLVPIVTSEEKAGKMPDILQAMPNACAYLVLPQWLKRWFINQHRRKLTVFYLDECIRRGWCEPTSPVYVPGAIEPDLPMQKFPVFVQNAWQIRENLKKQHIYLDDGWTGCVVCPANADSSCAYYEEGMDPVAEFVGESILSFPTHPTMSLKQAKRLIDAFAILIQKS